jgi:2-oxoglutarate ferredoxin oxidoreductase subunit gamma
LVRFEPNVCPGGVILVNSSLINEDPKRTDVTVYKVPMNDIAAKINKQTLNVVGLGCIVALSKAVDKASALKAIDKTFGKKFADKPQLLIINKDAFEKGFSAV